MSINEEDKTFDELSKADIEELAEEKLSKTSIDEKTDIESIKKQIIDEIDKVNKEKLKIKNDFIEKYGVDPTKPYKLSYEELYSISRKLQEKNSLFYRFWQIGAPVFTLSIPTACVAFDKKGACSGFYYNTMLWFDHDEYTRLFVICHEMLHVALNHGARTKDCDDKKMANIALDVVINHSLVNSFNFERNKIQDGEKYCWIETVFKYREEKGLDLPAEGKSFEFYYNMLKEDQENGNMPEGEMSGEGSPELVDDHSTLDDERFGEVIDELNESLSDKEKEKIKDFIEKNFQENREGEKKEEKTKKNGIQAGMSKGSWTFRDPQKRVIKKKWESIIHKWSSNLMVGDIRLQEQWIHQNSRYSCIADKDIILPSERMMEDKYPDKKRLNVWLFLDTSGSCIQYADRFFRAAESLDPKRFDLRLFCFDTQVEETDLKSKKVYGGGGTAFHIIEDKIQQVMRDEKKSYPDSIWCITDNEGTQVSPEKPERWHIFQTEYHSDPYICFPKQVKTFELKDFE